MLHRGKIEKTLKPSQRKSITEFASHFGSGLSYEEKVRNKRIISAVLTAVGILLLIAVGYFITDVLIRVTEAPVEQTAASQAAHGCSKEAEKWILSPIIQD